MQYVLIIDCDWFDNFLKNQLYHTIHRGLKLDSNAQLPTPQIQNADSS